MGRYKGRLTEEVTFCGLGECLILMRYVVESCKPLQREDVAASKNESVVSETA